MPKQPQKKTSSLRVLLIVLSSVIIVIATVIAIQAWALQNEKCVDIIGDGYAMGTDETPVVIGNTCD